MKPKTMLKITLYISLTCSILFCYIFAHYSYAEMVKKNEYPPMLWGTAIAGSFVVVAVIAFVVVGHMVTTINKIIKNLAD